MVENHSTPIIVEPMAGKGRRPIRPAPPKLGIGFLLLWTSLTAVLLTLWRPGGDAPVALALHLAWVVFGGALLAGAAGVARLRPRANRAGHWLLLAMAAGWLVRYLHMLSSQSEVLVPWNPVGLERVATSIVLAAGALWMVGSRGWRSSLTVLTAHWVAASMLPFLSLTDDRWWVGEAAYRGLMLSCAVCAAVPAWREAGSTSRAAPTDAYHRLGVLVWILGCLGRTIR